MIERLWELGGKIFLASILKLDKTRMRQGSSLCKIIVILNIIINEIYKYSKQINIVANTWVSNTEVHALW